MALPLQHSFRQMQSQFPLQHLSETAPLFTNLQILSPLLMGRKSIVQ